MITKVKNWSVVTIEDSNKNADSFKVLWAIVESSAGFKRNDYVCTSRILSIEDDLVITRSGSSYRLIGYGDEHTTSYAGLLLLGKGISPKELCK